MLTEAIYSLVDTTDQALLLVGHTRGEKPADATHPLGYGMEVYFWSFIVALMVFLVGGALSDRPRCQILNPAPVISPWIALTVLNNARGIRGNLFSHRVSGVYARAATHPAMGIHQGIERPCAVCRASRRISAALIGIGLAASGVIASSFFHITWADGVASVAIGLLLASVAWVLANETRSLIAGEAVAPIVMERLKEALARVDCITDLEDVATLHLGPAAILVALTLAFRRDFTTDMVEEVSGEITHDISGGGWPDCLCLCASVGSD